VIPARLVDRIPPTVTGSQGAVGLAADSAAGGRLRASTGQIVGRVSDATGAPIPGATVTLTGPHRTARTAVTDARGSYLIDQVPSGRVTVTSELAGFKTVKRSFVFDQRPRLVDFRMEVSGLTETVTVTAEAPFLDMDASERRETIDPDPLGPRDRLAGQRSGGQGKEAYAQQGPSQNVVNLQRRVAGVLPVRVDVPHAGTSYRFLRPLVLQEETTVTFRYKRR
jgi:hypothetical protein